MSTPHSLLTQRINSPATPPAVPNLSSMAAAAADNNNNCNSLSKAWIRVQRLLREDLILARRAADPAALRAALDRSLAHHDTYHTSRARMARSDQFVAFADPFTTSLERAAHWIAGWRPTIFIHLLYSELGLRFEAELDDLLLGVHSGDLGDLSQPQLEAIDALHCRTVRDEGELSQQLAEVQHAVADCFSPSDSDLLMQSQRLGDVHARADELRMRTLRELLGILEPGQAADLLVALADFEIGLRSIGVDHQRGRVDLSPNGANG